MNITDYIEKKEELKNLDFMTVYMTILTLIKDGYILIDYDIIDIS